jgi:glycosyltransferase involved in cell wall biosynthesis
MDVSIIICTYNGADKIEKTLASILYQKATCSYELIIVNNASTDNTAEVVKKYLTDNQADDFNSKLVDETTPGLINARLAGMKQASSDIMLFCDDDNILCDSYVQTGFELLTANPKIGVLGGLGIPEFESDKPDWFDRYYHSYAVGAQAEKDGKIDVYPAEVYGAGSFFRKKPLDRFYELGFKSLFKGRTGKVLSAGDDVEWCYLMQLAGYEIWYESHLQFKHLMPAGRLNWDYYVKMKSGIASGSAGFFIYAQLFKKNQISLFYFIFLAMHNYGYYTLLYIKHFTLITLFDRSNKIKKLGVAISLSKASSYRKRIFNGYNKYQRLYKLIHNN